ncbi:riboflavin-binding protein-like [Melanerpes formicivorus]|uniref:riboflavin-binding protein-like n=1 Tax=Melanerpes formicivorus TaxID=211600 RepID=UPI00358ED037
MLRFVVTLFAVITSSSCKKYGCLEGDTHKPKPSREPNMQECTLYSKSSCCYADFTGQLARSPVIKVNNSYWNRCGQLSKSCEDFTKKIECFYRCSPHAARWIHPNSTAAIQFVPLCQSFCDDWYEACKDDSICVRNWLTDWERDASGGNRCKNKCIPYSEMYANGTDMCQNMWGKSFKVSESSCLCLQMSEKDTVAIKYLRSASSEESSSSSSSEEHACQKKLSKFEKLQREKGENAR